MVEYSDGMEAYRTYPHVDRNETGERAARILSTVLERGRPTGRALRKPDFLIPLNFQCTLVEPSTGIVAASAQAADGDVLSLCYIAGFPPSDLYWCGPSTIVNAYSKPAADSAPTHPARATPDADPEHDEPLTSPAQRLRQPHE